jgi:hypothetical protein
LQLSCRIVSTERLLAEHEQPLVYFVLFQTARGEAVLKGVHIYRINQHPVRVKNSPPLSPCFIVGAMRVTCMLRNRLKIRKFNTALTEALSSLNKIPILIKYRCGWGFFPHGHKEVFVL